MSISHVEAYKDEKIGRNIVKVRFDVAPTELIIIDLKEGHDVIGKINDMFKELEKRGYSCIVDIKSKKIFCDTRFGIYEY